jgi:pyrroloquinoline quinone biosynthesis protein D
MTALTKVAGRFTEADIDHEIVIMRLDNGEFFSLSGTAAAIWRLIDGERDTAALVAAAASQFDVTESEISLDVEEFLAQLVDTGLLALV